METVSFISRQVLQWGDRVLGDRRIWGARGFIKNHSKVITVAATVIPIAIELFQNRDLILRGAIAAKNFLAHHFLPLDGELREDSMKRIGLNLCKAALVIMVTTAVCVSIYALVKLMITKGVFASIASALKLNEVISAVGKFLAKLIPPEKPPLVYAGYILFGILHFIQMLRQEKVWTPRTFMHAFGATVSFVTPLVMASGRYEARWHHLSYGLIFMLPPSRSMNFFGFGMVVDSLLYWVKPMKDNYDFSNIVQDSLAAFIIQMTALLVIQVGAHCIRKKLDGERAVPPKTLGGRLADKMIAAGGDLQNRIAAAAA